MIIDVSAIILVACARSSCPVLLLRVCPLGVHAKRNLTTVDQLVSCVANTIRPMPKSLPERISKILTLRGRNGNLKRLTPLPENLLPDLLIKAWNILDISWICSVEVLCGLFHNTESDSARDTLSPCFQSHRICQAIGLVYAPIYLFQGGKLREKSRPEQRPCPTFLCILQRFHIKVPIELEFDVFDVWVRLQGCYDLVVVSDILKYKLPLYDAWQGNAYLFHD